MRNYRRTRLPRTRSGRLGSLQVLPGVRPHGGRALRGRPGLQRHVRAGIVLSAARAFPERGHLQAAALRQPAGHVNRDHQLFMWPARSLDLMLLDCFLWLSLKKTCL